MGPWGGAPVRAACFSSDIKPCSAALLLLLLLCRLRNQAPVNAVIAHRPLNAETLNPTVMCAPEASTASRLGIPVFLAALQGQVVREH